MQLSTQILRACQLSKLFVFVGVVHFLELHVNKVLRDAHKAERNCYGAADAVELYGVHENVEEYLLEDFPVSSSPFWDLIHLLNLNVQVLGFPKLYNRLDKIKDVVLEVVLGIEHENVLVGDYLVVGRLRLHL
jgi:hypothetical protein